MENSTISVMLVKNDNEFKNQVPEVYKSWRDESRSAYAVAYDLSVNTLHSFDKAECNEFSNKILH